MQWKQRERRPMDDYVWTVELVFLERSFLPNFPLVSIAIAPPIEGRSSCSVGVEQIGLRLAAQLFTGNRRGAAMIQGLRTVIYPTTDLAEAKRWYSRVLEREPYF